MKRYQEIRKKTIIVDVDGVCGDFVSHLNKKMEEIGYKVNKDKLDKWSLTDRFYSIGGRDIEKDYLKILDNIDFWASIPLFKNVQEILKKIDKNYNLLIVTSPFPQVVDAFKEGRLQWLKKYFPFIKRDQIIFESKKWKIKADIIIEDKPETIEKFKGSLKIVMDAPYNQSIEVKYKRVNSWKEIEDILL